MVDYNIKEFEAALREVGVGSGEVVFSHSNLGFFGRLHGADSLAALCMMAFDAFARVLGPTGTLVVPTFTYSYCKKLPFDPLRSPSTCGAFTEWVRTHPDAVRSWDPIFSVAAVGARASELVDGLSGECFGPGSFWERFHAADGLVCNLNFDAGSTFIHWVEKALGASYRQDRAFRGITLEDGKEREREVVYYSRPLEDPSAIPNFEKFDFLARKKGVVRTRPVGRGAVVAVRARDTFTTVREGLSEDPYFLRENEGCP